jgi:cathepsin X
MCPVLILGIISILCRETLGYYIPSSNKTLQLIRNPVNLLPIETLPENLFWGNVNGTNFLTQARSQRIPEYCGACWAFASVATISDRLKIQRKAAWPDILLSPQVLISCEKEDFGCYGGDQINAFKFIQENGITDESCSPYQARGYSNGLDCSEQIWCQTCEHGNCQTPKEYQKWYIEDFGLISGEEAMLNELQRGPIACNIAANEALRNYTGGIFEDATGYMKINHVIVLVGYGVEDGVKYWVGKNSWGSYYGEYGFFKIVRGKNNLNIESYCAWANPKLEPQVVQNRYYKNKVRLYFDDSVINNKQCRDQNLVNLYDEKVTEIRAHEILLKAEVPEVWDWRNISGQNYLSVSYNEQTLFYCASCWTHSVTASLSDRINILRNNQFPKISLSPQAAINCGMGGSCNGGSPLGVYEFAYTHGIPDDTCQSYIAQDPEEAVCEASPRCWMCVPAPAKIGGHSKCLPVKDPKLYYVSSYGKVSGASRMKSEIFLNGPISCGMSSTPIFRNYTAGMYAEESKDYTLNHEVSVVGWGKFENGTEYWIGRNSWGTYWGDHGFFKIQMHENNLGIETDCSWGIPSFTKVSNHI